MTRIALDILPFWAPLTGIGIYVQQLLLAMFRDPKIDCEWRFPVQSSYLFRYVINQRMQRCLGHSKARIDFQWTPFGEFRAKTKGLVLQPAQSGAYSLFHGLNVPVRFTTRDMPVVITAYDITWMRLPSDVCRPPPICGLEQYPEMLRNAQLVLCISEATRRDVQEIIGVPDERLIVTPLAARPMFQPPADETLRSAARARAAAGRPYFLALGTIEPRKNLPRLIEAMALLRRSGADHRLVLVGRKGWGWKAVRNSIRKCGLSDYVKVIGYADDQTVRQFIWGADALVIPSLYEGFGLPVLEAMACGTPVIAANAGSLPEVAGGAAILVEPLDVDSIAEGLHHIAEHPIHAEQLRHRGLERAQHFSWSKTARITWDAYMRLLK